MQSLYGTVSARIKGLKKIVFHEMLEMAGRVFIVAKYSGKVRIGNRGFTEDEKKNGMVLVFNKSMKFIWDDSGIRSTLIFGSSPQKCFIPLEDIMVIYSPELNSQFMTTPDLQKKVSDTEAGQKMGEPEEREMSSDGPNVVRVDFQKKRTSKSPKLHRSGEGSDHEP